MTTQRYYSSTAQPMVLTAGVSNSALSLLLNSASGLPSQCPFSLVLDPGTASEEIVTVNVVAGLTVTVVRGEDGSAAVLHTTGAVVRHMMTARDLREPQVHIDASAGVHGLGPSSVVVGNATVQTLTNKSMNGTENTFTSIPQSAITDLDADQAAETAARIAGDGAEAAARGVAIVAEAGTRGAADTALDGRVTALEADTVTAATDPGHVSGRIWVNSTTGLAQMSAGGAWHYLSGPMVRAWSAYRAIGTGSDGFAGNSSFVGMGGLTITTALPGTYQVNVQATIQGSVAQQGYVGIRANGVAIGYWRADAFTSPTPMALTVPFEHTSGDIVFTWGYTGTGGSLTIFNEGAGITIYYLGER
jgi:hypothetical protein